MDELEFWLNLQHSETEHDESGKIEPFAELGSIEYYINQITSSDDISEDLFQIIEEDAVVRQEYYEPSQSKDIKLVIEDLFSTTPHETKIEKPSSDTHSQNSDKTFKLLEKQLEFLPMQSAPALATDACANSKSSRRLEIIEPISDWFDIFSIPARVICIKTSNSENFSEKLQNYHKDTIVIFNVQQILTKQQAGMKPSKAFQTYKNLEEKIVYENKTCLTVKGLAKFFSRLCRKFIAAKYLDSINDYLLRQMQINPVEETKKRLRSEDSKTSFEEQPNIKRQKLNTRMLQPTAAPTDALPQFFQKLSKDQLISELVQLYDKRI